MRRMYSCCDCFCSSFLAVYCLERRTLLPLLLSGVAAAALLTSRLLLAGVERPPRGVVRVRASIRLSLC